MDLDCLYSADLLTATQLKLKYYKARYFHN